MPFFTAGLPLKALLYFKQPLYKTGWFGAFVELNQHPFYGIKNDNHYTSGLQPCFV